MIRAGDRLWRAAGAILLITGGLAGALSDLGDGEGSAVLLLGFPLAMLGLVLAVQGRRAPLAIRVECSRHRLLPERLHARRASRRHER
ncbi:hypothetical protein [Sphingomonas sp. TDK1]|uniref:hypothetical protein n=1 Tax=Sphingomonas sp. TDK1 TaxID=453247 RepID=UPI0007DA3730|nr:hypothetical protein [Sphingomonas sp. TDK1]OAN57617.1 hypothetical protein A7X12_07090 [Sphingomonas sp. TDK1]